MVLIKFFKDPTGEPELINAGCVGEWLLTTYGDTGLPDELRIFKGHCSDSTDVSGSIEALTETEGEFEVCLMPGTPIQIVWALVVVIIALVVVLAMRKPLSLNNRQQGSSTNALSNRSNQARPNQRIVDIRGKVAGHMPDQLMYPYKVFEENVEVEYSYMCIGVGEYNITNIKDGDTLVADLIGSACTFYKPHEVPGFGTPYMSVGEMPVELLWNISRSNEIDGNTLLAPNFINMTSVIFNILPNRTVTATTSGTTFTFIGNLVVGSRVAITGVFLEYVGIYNVAIGDNTVPKAVYKKVSLDGVYPITSVSALSVSFAAPLWPTDGTSWVNGQPATRLDHETTITPESGVPFNGVVLNAIPTPDLGAMPDFVFNPTIVSGPSPYEIIASIPKNTAEVWLNFVALSGLYKEDNDGIYPNQISIQCTIYEMLNGIRTGASTPSFTMIAGDQKKNVGITKKITLPYPECQLGVTRITPTDKEFGGNIVDEVKWRDLYRAVQNTQSDFGNVTTVHTVRKATETALSSRDPKFNVTAIRDNQDQFADVVKGMALDPTFGRLLSSQIDLENLYDVQDQINGYFNNANVTRVGYAFDDASISFEEAVSMICDAVNVIAYRMGGVLKFKFERAQTESSMQFTHRSKWPKSDVKSRLFKSEKEHDGIELTYRDEITAADLTITLPNDNIAFNPKRIELSACITNFGAVIRARREYNKLVYSRVMHTFDSFGIARTLLPNTRIDVTDGTVGPYEDGEILDQSGLVVRLSQPITFTPGKSHSIVVTKRDGGIEGIPVTQYGTDQYRVVLSRPPAESLFIGHMQAKTQYNFGADDTFSAMAMLVQSVEPSITNGEEKIAIRALNYDHRYYIGDLQPI